MTHKLSHKVATAALVASSLLFGGNALAEPTGAVEAPATIVAAQPAPSRSQALQTQNVQSDAQRYAQRERATPQLAKFRGGDTVVIGASAVAIILAVVLIIVLI
jgi:hypothetical protein